MEIDFDCPVLPLSPKSHVQPLQIYFLEKVALLGYLFCPWQLHVSACDSSWIKHNSQKIDVFGDKRQKQYYGLFMPVLGVHAVRQLRRSMWCQQNRKYQWWKCFLMARDGAQWFTAESFVLHQGGAVWDQAAELQKVNANLCSFVTHNSDIFPQQHRKYQILKIQ